MEREAVTEFAQYGKLYSVVLSIGFVCIDSVHTEREYDYRLKKAMADLAVMVLAITDNRECLVKMKAPESKDMTPLDENEYHTNRIKSKLTTVEWIVSANYPLRVANNESPNNLTATIGLQHR